MNLGLKLSITFIIGLGWIGLFGWAFGLIGVVTLLAVAFMVGSVATLAAIWTDFFTDW